MAKLWRGRRGRWRRRWIFGLRGAAEANRTPVTWRWQLIKVIWTRITCVPAGAHGDACQESFELSRTLGKNDCSDLGRITNRRMCYTHEARLQKPATARAVLRQIRVLSHPRARSTIEAPPLDAIKIMRRAGVPRVRCAVNSARSAGYVRPIAMLHTEIGSVKDVARVWLIDVTPALVQHANVV